MQRLGIIVVIAILTGAVIGLANVVSGLHAPAYFVGAISGAASVIMVLLVNRRLNKKP